MSGGDNVSLNEWADAMEAMDKRSQLEDVSLVMDRHEEILKHLGRLQERHIRWVKRCYVAWQAKEAAERKLVDAMAEMAILKGRIKELEEKHGTE